MAATGSGHIEPWELHVGETWWEDLADMANLTEETLLAELIRQYTGALSVLSVFHHFCALGLCSYASVCALHTSLHKFT